MTADIQPRYVSVETGATYADCSRDTVRRMILRGQLTAYRIGKRGVRIDLNELDALMRRNVGQVA